MEFNPEQLRNFAVALLAIANPLGKIPVWIQASEDECSEVRRWLAVLLVLAGAAILVAMMFFGPDVLSFFGIELAAFRIGGGIVILTVGLSMMRGQVADTDSSSEEGDSPLQTARARFRGLVVPIAVPLIAGPGSITTVLVYSSRTEGLGNRVAMAGVVLAVCGLLLTVMLASRRIENLLGKTLLTVQTRLFGLLLTALAAQLMVEGLGQVFPSLIESYEIPSSILDEVREQHENGSKSEDG